MTLTQHPPCLCNISHSSIPGLCTVCQRPLTLLDSGGQAQLASFDLLYGCLQARRQQLCDFQVQHQLLCIAAKKARCNTNTPVEQHYVSRGRRATLWGVKE